MNQALIADQQWSLDTITSFTGFADRSFNDAAVDIFYNGDKVVAVNIWCGIDTRPTLCVKLAEDGRFRPYQLIANDDVPAFTRNAVMKNCLVEFRERTPVSLVVYAGGEPEPAIVLARMSPAEWKAEVAEWSERELGVNFDSETEIARIGIVSRYLALPNNPRARMKP